MNQVKLGEKAGIDTAEVQSWDMREVAGLQSTHVDFKNGITVILRGEAKVAFDAWAVTLPSMRGKEREWSGCFETREEEPETKPPQKAKVLLLSRIWECSKCGEVLATDLDGKPANMTDAQGGEIVVNGEVRIQADGILSVTCWQCQTANEWPEALRERVAKGTAEEGADDRTG